MKQKGDDGKTQPDAPMTGKEVSCRQAERDHPTNQMRAFSEVHLPEQVFEAGLADGHLKGRVEPAKRSVPQQPAEAVHSDPSIHPPLALPTPETESPRIHPQQKLLREETHKSADHPGK